jgi:hypothetical protein
VSGAPPLRPGEVCRRLLGALDAAEGRRRGRKRDTTPDAIGLAVKRALLVRAAEDDPDPEAFEAWLVARCDAARGDGTWRAMALEVLDECRLAAASPAFLAWLERGAPSDDASGRDQRTDQQGSTPA